MHSRTRLCHPVAVLEYFKTGARRLGLVAIGVVALTSQVFGQLNGGFAGNQAVGGISVDADGIVQNLEPQALQSLVATRRQALAGKPLGGDGQRELQKVSLRRIIAAVEAALAAGTNVPADVLTLGGLERIEYVFVDPDARDLILAGPADTAIVDDSGTIVAASSGRPLLLLEDLVVALRAIDAARMGGMQCSIDPSPEGLARLRAMLKQAKSVGNPQQMYRAMEQALGPQQISLGGVPADSHFAQVLVAADYRLKRIGMGLEPSGIAQLPSYLSMVPATVGATILPRFWLEAMYEPLARDPDELAWKFSGRQMVCLTESDLLARQEIKRGAGRADLIATRWCGLMTEHYNALARQQPVFAELANCVDLAVLAALMESRQLADRAGLDLTPLLDASRVRLPTYPVATQVPTVAHGIKKGTRWVLSASGGVQFQPWALIEEVVENDDVARVRSLALVGRSEQGFYWE